MLFSIQSGSQAPLSSHKWYLSVGLFCCIDLSRFRGPTPTYSWEYFTTLDYEFDIIRGRRPHRWKTWVRNRRRHFLTLSLLTLDLGLIHIDHWLDLLPFTRGHPNGCNTQLRRSYHYDSNQLSGR